MLVARNRVVGAFDRPAEARSCFSHLQRGQVLRPDTTIWVKPSKSVVEIGFTARDARKAVLRTLVLGAATGFLLGAIGGTVLAHVTDASMALGWSAAALAMLFGALVALLWGPPASQPALTAAATADEPLELTVETSHPSLRPGGCAAFAVDGVDGDAVVVVAEVESRGSLDEGDHPPIEDRIAAVRQALSEEHELQAQAIVLIAAGGLPRTTSGKRQRLACRAAWQSGSLPVVSEWTRTALPATRSKPLQEVR